MKIDKIRYLASRVFGEKIYPELLNEKEIKKINMTLKILLELIREGVNEKEVKKMIKEMQDKLEGGDKELKEIVDGIKEGTIKEIMEGIKRIEEKEKKEEKKETKMNKAIKKEETKRIKKEIQRLHTEIRVSAEELNKPLLMPEIKSKEIKKRIEDRMGRILESKDKVGMEIIEILKGIDMKREILSKLEIYGAQKRIEEKAGKEKIQLLKTTKKTGKIETWKKEEQEEEQK